MTRGRSGFDTPPCVFHLRESEDERNVFLRETQTQFYSFGTSLAEFWRGCEGDLPFAHDSLGAAG